MALIEVYDIKRPSDIYRLTLDQLIDLFGTGDGSNIYAEIQLSKGMSLEKFLICLGIPDLGPTRAETVARFYKTLKCFLDDDKLRDTLTLLSGVGEGVANSVASWLEDIRNRDEIDRLLKLGVTTGEANAVEGGKLEGTLWVVTGSIPGYTKDFVKQFVQQHGGRYSTNLSKETTHLIVGENAGSKVEKAKKYNTALVTPEEFAKHVEELSNVTG